MKKTLSTVIGLIICVSLYAQKPAIKFGNVPMESLTMKRYAADSSASAVILGDYGSSTIQYSQSLGFSLIFERTTRIKILKKEGFTWGDFEIPLYKDGASDEKLAMLKAQTTNLEDGKVVETKVKNESIFRTDENENLRLVKVTFPNVKEGSVIDITYRVNSEFFSNFQDWQFQYSIPVVVSEYRANIPEWFHYDRYMQGYITLATADHSAGQQSVNTGDATPLVYSENRERWVAEDVPAFNAEPYITTEKDYISKINFELAYTKFPNAAIKQYMGSWDDINKTYTESDGFFGEITGNNFLKKNVDELIAGLTTDRDKAVALNNYVKNNFSWTNSVRKFPESSFKKILEEKKGSSAELNLLLASMLEKAGLQVSPVLISTRDHGFVRETIPISTQFNGVICLVKIGDKTMLLDATDPLLPAGVLPQRCLNGRGFVIAKTGHSWIDLTVPMKSKVFANADFTLDPAGSITGKLSIDRSGYSAQGMRSKYISKGEVEYLKDFSSGKTWQVNKSEIKNVKEINEPLKEQYDILHDAYADVSGDLIYLNPFLLLREESNPFKAEKREYPVNFGNTLEKFYVGKFAAPDGYVIDEAPQNKIIALPGNAAKFTFNVAIYGKQVVITSILQINRDIFLQEEYPNLREFYNQVVAKHSEQIVFKKVEK
jgi:transglutaminase-like putative cysteine protease